MIKPMVLVTNKINEVGLAKLRDGTDLQYLDYKMTPPEQFNKILRTCEGICLRGPVKLTESVLNECPNLKIISKHGVGLEGIDIEAATKLGIIISNSGGANASAVAEGAVALILGTIRRLQEMRDIIVGDNYHQGRNGVEFQDLRGKTIGVVGFGNIGRIVSQILKDGFGCKILVLDPMVPADEMASEGVTKVNRLDEMLPQVDVLTVHVPLTPETQYLLGMEQFKRMKKNALVINTSRGGIINENDLAAALQQGIIFGAGLDTMESEPPPKDHPLLAQKNVVLTPHCAGGTASARINSTTESVDGLIDVLLNATAPRYFINPEVLGHTRATLHQRRTRKGLEPLPNA